MDDPNQRLMTRQRKKPKQQVVALHYDSSREAAPKVTAKGKGAIAEAIIKKAKEAGVPLMEDPDLVALLSHVELGETVPPELYRAVAEVLSYVYKLNNKMPKVESEL